jgi:hypothetical protein
VLNFEKNKRGHWSSVAKTLDGGYYSVNLKAAMVTENECQIWFYGWHASRRDSMGRIQRQLGGFKTRKEAQTACAAHWLRN